MLAHACRPSAPDSLGLPSGPAHRSRTSNRSGPLAIIGAGCLASRRGRRDTHVHLSPWSLLPHAPERRPRTAPGAVQSRGSPGGIAASGTRGRGAHPVAGIASGDEHAMSAQPRAFAGDLPRSRSRSRRLPCSSAERRTRGGIGGVCDAWNYSDGKSHHLRSGVILIRCGILPRTHAHSACSAPHPECLRPA
jgi:hypothetical protein